MRILDDCNNEILDPDYTKGYTTPETIVIYHHPAVYPIRGVGHWQTIETHENGGKLVRWVNDIPPEPTKPAWDETEDILRWHWYPEPEPEPEEEGEM